MKYRSVKLIVPARQTTMGGHLMYKPLPHKKVAQIDPFLVIDHINSPLKGGQKPYEVGVGPHPHRGFSPVTLVFKGNVEHRDSLGNQAIINAGGTQWIHAGRVTEAQDDETCSEIEAGV